MLARIQSGRLAAASDFLKLAIILGLLPVLSGVLLRSYGFGLQPMWLESLRMIDFLDIVAEVLIILWARHRGLNFAQYWQMLPKYMKAAVATFIATFWIGAVFNSPIAPISIIRSSYWIIHLAFGLAVYHLVKTSEIESKINVRHFVYWQVLGIAILAIITALHLSYLALLPPSFADQIKWSGAIPGCMSVRHFGILVGSVAALYAGYFFWTATQRFNLPITMLICTLLLGLTFWSGTRGAAVAFAGAFLMLIVATKTLPAAPKLGVMMLSAIFGVIVFSLLLPPDPAFGLFRLIYPEPGLNLDDLSSGRIAIWQFVWDLFLDQWAFGWGEGAMHGIDINETGLRHMQPHNSIFQFLYSWGIFAASAMFVVIGLVIFRLHRNVANNVVLAGPLMMADSLLIMSLFDGALFFARMIMPLIFCLALCIALENRTSDEASSEN